MVTLALAGPLWDLLQGVKKVLDKRNPAPFGEHE